MNFRTAAFHTAIILMVQLPLASFGQEQSKTPRAEPRDQTAMPRSDIYQILDHARRLADDARGLQSKEEEIKLQASLADCVWPMDQSLGQRLLLRSFDLTIAAVKEPFEPLRSSSATDPNVLFRQISSIAAKHDAKLEKKLKESWQETLASLADKPDSSKTDPGQLSQLLLSQSATYLKSDEEKGRQLFRQSVSLRVLPYHCFFMMSQRKRAVDVTDRLFNDTLDVLAHRPIFEANEILLLSSYLFSPEGSIAYRAISGYNAANTAGNTSASPANSVLAKRYLELLLTKMNPSEILPVGVAYFALKNLVPQYQALAPELLNEVYAKMATFGPSVSKDDLTAFDEAHTDLTASETEKIADWEKRIGNAGKFDSEDRRDLEYFTILLGYLLPKKDFARAELVVSRISNQDVKQKLGDFLNFHALHANLEKSENASSVSEADCNKIKDPLVRVVALSTLGQGLLKQKATADALRLFDRAAAQASQIQNDQDRLQARLMLVQLYLNADSSLGFQSAVTAFKEINKFSDFNMRRSKFLLRVTVYGLDNQLEIHSPIGSSLALVVARMSQRNYVETLQTCSVLEKKEVRLWATFEVLRTALFESARASKTTLQ